MLSFGIELYCVSRTIVMLSLHDLDPRCCQDENVTAPTKNLIKIKRYMGTGFFVLIKSELDGNWFLLPPLNMYGCVAH